MYDHSTLVSVGIPTFERPELLQRAVGSVLDQSHRNLDVHISDNGSSDPRVRDVINSLAERDGRVRYTSHSSNRGPLWNFRFLLESARGPLFCWLSDDDYLSKGWVESLVRAHSDATSITFGRFVTASSSDKGSEVLVLGGARAGGGREALRLFARVNQDVLVHGLMRTDAAITLTPLIKPWSLPSRLPAGADSIPLDFALYPYLFGLFVQGDLVSVDDESVNHFSGVSEQKEVATHRPGLARSFRLCFYLLLVEVQLQIRLLNAARLVRRVEAFCLAPLTGLRLLRRKIQVKLSLRRRTKPDLMHARRAG